MKNSIFKICSCCNKQYDVNDEDCDDLSADDNSNKWFCSYDCMRKYGYINDDYFGIVNQKTLADKLVSAYNNKEWHYDTIDGVRSIVFNINVLE